MQACDTDSDLRLLLTVCDLLGTCTIGECQFAEFVTKQFFSIDELLQ